MGRFRRRGPILNEEEDESVLLPREEESDAAMGGPTKRARCGRERPTDRPTSACYTVARRGEATRRRVAAVAAPWNGLDGYATAGLGPPAMDGWPNGALVSYKES